MEWLRNDSFRIFVSTEALLLHTGRFSFSLMGFFRQRHTGRQDIMPTLCRAYIFRDCIFMLHNIKWRKQYSVTLEFGIKQM